MAMLSIGELALGSAASAGINTRIPWSALEYSAGTDVITSISGSSIGSTVDTSQLMPKSASSEFYPMTGNPSGFVTGGPYQPSGDYVYESSFSAFSSDTTADISSLSSIVSSISGNTGDYVEKSSISAESAQWNEVSGLSGKLDSSASSSFYPMTGNPSGFLTEADVSSSYIPVSALETDENSAITAISGSAIAGGGGLTGDYVEKSAYHLQIGTGNTVLPSTSNPNKGTWAVIGSGNNMSRSSSALPNNDVSHVLIGQDNSAENGTSIAIGVQNSAQGTKVNILLGKYNQIYSGGDYGAAIGYGANAGIDSVSIGQHVSSTNNSVAIGVSAAAYDNSLGIQVGWMSRTSASSNSYAIGQSNSAMRNSVAIGQGNSAASASLSVGFLNTATKSSNLYGCGLIGSDHLTVLGQWNSASAGSGNTAFVFGDGSSNKRHDLMLLLRSGDIVINGSANSGVPVVSTIKDMSSTLSGHSSRWSTVSGRIPFSALQYSAGTTKITAISGSAIGAESLNTAALVAGDGISIELSGDGNYHINNTSRSRASARDGFGISGSSYTDAGGVQYTTFGLDSAESYIGTQFRYAIQSSFPATAYEQEVPLVAQQSMPYGYTSYMIKLDAIVSCPYAATWSLVETYNNTWDNSSASAVIALDRTEGGNSSMVHLRGETLAGGNNASARMVNVMVKFDEAPVGDQTVTVHDQVGYFVRIPQGLIANGWLA